MALVKTEGFSLHLKLSNLLFGLIIFFCHPVGLPFLATVEPRLWHPHRLPRSHSLFLRYFNRCVPVLVVRLFDRRPKQSSSLPESGWDAEGVSLLIGVIPVLLVNFVIFRQSLATLSWSLHFILYFAFL